MKKNTFTFLLILSIFTLIISSCSKQEQKPLAKEVTVYAYDSFIGSWGPGEEIARLFKEKTGIQVNYVECEDAVQAFSKALLEKDAPQTDIVLGVDNNLAAKAMEEDLFISYKPANADSLLTEGLENELGGNWILTPFDYSHFAMIFNTNSDVKAPESLEDLTDSRFRKKIILMDPRTSTPGLGFFAWTVMKYGTGSELENFWKALRPNILTMTSGWSEGWGMFLDGEAPLVISYTTSPAYNVEYENDYSSVALIFAEGHVQQVEGAGIVKNAPHTEEAKLFLDFLITEEAQNVLPLTQWMNPANKNVVLPKSYQEAAPIPETTLYTYNTEMTDALNRVMNILEK